MYSQSKNIFLKKRKKERRSSSNDLPRFKRKSTRCVQKTANNFWLCRKGKPFAHQGQPLPSIDKTMEQLAGVLLLMRESFLQGDERIIRSGSRGRPLASKVSIERRWPHQRGTDLTCRSIWDAGVSGFISDAHHTTS